MATMRLGADLPSGASGIKSPYSQLAAQEGYSQDEVGELAAVFELLDRTTDDLTEANSQLEIRNRDLDDARSKLRKNLDRLELEMNAARKLQLSMVARDGEVMRFGADVEAVGLMEPAREVGGDFYDIFNIDENMVCFFIGDVSDKGTPSALLMSRTVSLVRFATLQLARLDRGYADPFGYFRTGQRRAVQEQLDTNVCYAVLRDFRYADGSVVLWQCRACQPACWGRIGHHDLKRRPARPAFGNSVWDGL